MNNAELYQKYNIISKYDALQCLQEYGIQVKWKNGRLRILDVGCGDGSVTMSILKQFIPSNYESLVGCDISKNMIQYANEKYANDHTSFIVQDIEGELRKELRGTFDHVFSFYAMHWIQNQELGFKNIYDLLSDGGECFLVLMGQWPLFDVYRTLSQSTKWKTWCKDAERFISPYHDCPDPATKVKELMTSIGFSSVEVDCLNKTFVYPELDIIRGSVKSINPFKIPIELEEDFLEDYFNILPEIGVIDPKQVSDNHGEPIKATFNYRLIVAKGKK